MVKYLSSIKETERLKTVPKVGDKAGKALFQEGYTLEKLATAVPQDIVNILKYTMKKSQEVIANAQTILAKDSPPPLLASEYQKEMDNIRWTLKTDSKELNKLLGGGFKSYSTVGASGPFSTGKTQLGNEMIVQVQKMFPNEDEGYTIFIETELDTFSNRRLTQMATGKGVTYNPDKVILVPSQRIMDVGNQYYQYERANDLAMSMGADVKLIIVDSFTALFKRKYSGRALFPDRSQELGRHLSYLEDMTKRFNAVLYCTCQVIEVPVTPQEAKGGYSSANTYWDTGTRYIPWGGNVLKHTLGTWISMDKKGKTTYQFILFDSSELPKGDILIAITSSGLKDVTKRELV